VSTHNYPHNFQVQYKKTPKLKNKTSSPEKSTLCWQGWIRLIFVSHCYIFISSKHNYSVKWLKCYSAKSLNCYGVILINFYLQNHHILPSPHPPIITSPHHHIPPSHIPTSSHPPIPHLPSPHPPISTSPHLHIITSSNYQIPTSPHHSGTIHQRGLALAL